MFYILFVKNANYDPFYMHSDCIIIIHLDQLYVLTQSYMQIIVKVIVNGYIKLVKYLTV